jgi:hypothetical protein
VRPANLAQTAAERFVEGADAPFLACFDENVVVYREPAISKRPVVSSRAELGLWLTRLRAEQPRLDITLTEPTEHGKGAVCELIVVREAHPSDVWRVALGVCVMDDLIREVRAFWSMQAALDWVAKFW